MLKKSINYIIVIAIAAILIFTYIYNNEESQKTNDIFSVEEYSTDDEIWNKADNLESIKDCNRVLVRGHFLSDVEYGEKVWIQEYRSSVNIYYGERELFKTKHNELDKQNPFSYDWYNFTSQGISKDDTITIEIDGKYSGADASKLIKRMYKGEKFDVLKNNIRVHFQQICIGVLMICIGFTLVLTVLILKFMSNEIPMNYIFCGGLLIVGGICTLIDYGYITLLISDVQAVNIADYLSQCFICLFLLLYMVSFLKTPSLKRIGIILSILLATSIVGCFVVPCDMERYISIQLPGVVIVITASICSIIYELIKLKNNDTKYLIFSGSGLSIFVILEMLHYFITGEYWVVVFQLGMLIFVFMQFFFLIRYANKTIKEAAEAAKLEKELTESRIQIMLSQIQPHFLYNSLGTIKYLCATNPQKAQEAVQNFAVFLRNNVDLLSTIHLISFKKELEYVKNYISLEKMRFGDDLKVIYDIQTEDFIVPTLTLQPIVENAVRYGVNKNESGGTITIKSYETVENYVIEVNDDGDGFDTNEKKKDGKSHVGMKNVTTRLSELVGGKMQINSIKGKGTSVMIIIPKTKNERQHINEMYSSR